MKLIYGKIHRQVLLMAAKYRQGPESTSRASNVPGKCMYRPRLERSAFWYTLLKHKERFGMY